jgi:hypothetical protein
MFPIDDSARRFVVPLIEDDPKFREAQQSIVRGTKDQQGH